MSFETLLLVNGISRFVVAIASLFVGFLLSREKESRIPTPLYILSAVLFVSALLDLFWYFGLIGFSEADLAFVSPGFNIAMMAVWFYIGILISEHRNIYYFIPLFIMSINALLLFSDLAVVCDIISGLVLIGVFLHRICPSSRA